MIVLETIAVAFAMFSAIPCPQPTWNEKNMRFMMVAFPLVGVACGALCAGWFVLMQFLAAPALLQGAGFCLIPVLVTGGIHLDGYADTCDARASCAPPEKKREILKDPQCGAFAVIHLCVWFVADFTLCACIRWEKNVLWCLCLGFVLERCLSGLAIASFPMAKQTGLAHTFAAASDKKKVRICLLLLAMGLTAALILVGRWMGALVALTMLFLFGRYYVISKKEFEGITGDLAGWFVQRAELGMLVALLAVQLLEGATWSL